MGVYPFALLLSFGGHPPRDTGVVSILTTGMSSLASCGEIGRSAVSEDLPVDQVRHWYGPRVINLEARFLRRSGLLPEHGCPWAIASSIQ